MEQLYRDFKKLLISRLEDIKTSSDDIIGELLENVIEELKENE